MIAVGAVAESPEIVKWVDEDGITHFGNPQFAPPEKAEAVEVHPANAMDVPDASHVPSAKRTGRQYVELKKPGKKNKRGWRGYRSKRQRS
jgi:hypothetical protein